MVKVDSEATTCRNEFNNNSTINCEKSHDFLIISGRWKSIPDKVKVWVYGFSQKQLFQQQLLLCN